MSERTYFSRRQSMCSFFPACVITREGTETPPLRLRAVRAQQYFKEEEGLAAGTRDHQQTCSHTVRPRAYSTTLLEVMIRGEAEEGAHHSPRLRAVVLAGFVRHRLCRSALHQRFPWRLVCVLSPHCRSRAVVWPLRHVPFRLSQTRRVAAVLRHHLRSSFPVRERTQQLQSCNSRM